MKSVLRVLRGEDLDSLSGEFSVGAVALSELRAAFLAARRPA